MYMLSRGKKLPVYQLNEEHLTGPKCRLTSLESTKLDFKKPL